MNDNKNPVPTKTPSKNKNSKSDELKVQKNFMEDVKSKNQNHPNRFDYIDCEKLSLPNPIDKNPTNRFYNINPTLDFQTDFHIQKNEVNKYDDNGCRDQINPLHLKTDFIKNPQPISLNDKKDLISQWLEPQNNQKDAEVLVYLEKLEKKLHRFSEILFEFSPRFIICFRDELQEKEYQKIKQGYESPWAHGKSIDQMNILNHLLKTIDQEKNKLKQLKLLNAQFSSKYIDSRLNRQTFVPRKENQTDPNHNQIMSLIDVFLKTDKICDAVQIIEKIESLFQLKMGNTDAIPKNEKKNITTKRKEYNILVVGSVGVGKSHFLNLLVGKQLFTTSKEPQGCTSHIEFKTHDLNENGMARCTLNLYDTPGFFSQKIQPKMFYMQLFEKFFFKKIDFIFICLSSQITRNLLQDIAMLKLLFLAMKTPKMDFLTTKVGIVFTQMHKFYEEAEKQEFLRDFHLQIIDDLNKNFGTGNGQICNKWFFGDKNTDAEIEGCLKFLLTEMSDEQVSFKIPSLSVARNILNEILSGNHKSSPFKQKQSCFHPDSKILKQALNGSTLEVPIEDATEGDRVLVNGKGEFQTVMTTSVYDVENRNLMKIKLGNRRKCEKILALTPSHYVFRWANDRIEMVPAEKIFRCDKMLGVDDEIYEVLETEEVKYTGKLYNIRTTESNVMVNGVKCSCFEENGSGILGHWLLKISHRLHHKLPNKINDIGIFLLKLFNK